MGDLNGLPREIARVRNVAPLQLVIRCYAEKQEDYWQAFSLEFGLAVQGDSLADVKSRLESMISSYVYDALVGEDRQYAAELLARRASPSVYAKYYFNDICTRVDRLIGASTDRLTFSESLPLEPRACAA